MLFFTIGVISTITTTLGIEQQASQNCNISRFSVPFFYVQRIENEGVSLDEFTYKLDTQKNLIDDFENQLAERTFSIQLSQSAQSRNLSDGRSLSSHNSISNSLDLSQNLNIIELSSRQNLLKLRKEIAKQELKRLIRSHQIELFRHVIDIADAQTFEKIITKKLQLRQLELQFYDQKFDDGEISQTDILTVKTEIRRLRDQLVANKIKLSGIYAELGISQLSIRTDDFFDSVDELSSEFNYCEYDTFEASNIRREILLKREELRTLAISANYDLSLSASFSESRNINRASETDAKIGLNFSVPIYDGGSRRNELSKKLAEIGSLQTHLNNTSASAAAELQERANTEMIYKTSLAGIENEMSDIEQRIVELKTRGELGQSVFLESNTALLEYWGLQESSMRIKKDFLTGWLAFLAKRYEKP